MLITNIIALVLGIVAVGVTAWVFWNEFLSKINDVVKPSVDLKTRRRRDLVQERFNYSQNTTLTHS